MIHLRRIYFVGEILFLKCKLLVIRMKIKGILFTVLSALLYGFTPVLASITYDMGNTPLTMTFFRNLFAGIFLLGFIQYKKIDLKVVKGDIKNLLFVSVIGVLLSNILLYSSYSYIGVGSTTTLHFTYPIFVALFARFFFKEEIHTRKKIVLVMASIGVLFFIDVKDMVNMVGIFYAVLSGVFYAFYMVWMEKKNLASQNPYKISFYICLFSAITLTISNFFFKFLVFDLSPLAYILIIISAIATSFLATVFLQLGIHEIGSTSAALFCLVEPITSIISGAIILNETLNISKVVGCIIIFLAISLLTIDKEEKEEKIILEKP